jgi:hypothetical protein
MIKEFEFYHGAVLTKIAQSDIKTSISSFPSPSRCSYVINGYTGLYIKHSTNRLTPWGFSFAKVHQDEIKKMANELDKVFVALVCGKDGIACLSFQELKNVLDDNHSDHEWIRVSRRTREKYSIKGSDGKLKFKIAHNHFPDRILENPGGIGKFIQNKLGINQ